MRADKQILLLLLGLIIISGCSTNRPEAPPQIVTVEVPENPVPGTVSEPWVEPIYNNVEIPGQLDPQGVYYRERHKTVIEIRPGMFQHRGE